MDKAQLLILRLEIGRAANTLERIEVLLQALVGGADHGKKDERETNENT